MALKEKEKRFLENDDSGRSSVAVGEQISRCPDDVTRRNDAAALRKLHQLLDLPSMTTKNRKKCPSFNKKDKND